MSAPRCLGSAAMDADRLGRGLEQNVVHDRLVLERDGARWAPARVKTRWKYGHRQQVGLTIGQAIAHRARPWHFGTVPVATAVVGDAGLAAVLAALDMAAEGRGAASLDGGHDAALRHARGGQRCAVRNASPWRRKMSATSSTGRMSRLSREELPQR